MKCYEVKREGDREKKSGMKMKFDDSIHVLNKYGINRARK